MTYTSFSTSGAPVSRWELSEHTLYDLDAVDHYQDCEPEAEDDDMTAEEFAAWKAEQDREDARIAALVAAGPF